MYDFLDGFLYAFVHANHLDELKSCMGSNEKLFTRVQYILDNMRDGSFMAMTNAMGATYDMVNDVPTDLGACNNLASDLQKVKDWVNAIGIYSAAMATYQNMTMIRYYVVELFRALYLGDWYKVGENVALAFSASVASQVELYPTWE